MGELRQKTWRPSFPPQTRPQRVNCDSRSISQPLKMLVNINDSLVLQLLDDNPSPETLETLRAILCSSAEDAGVHPLLAEEDVNLEAPIEAPIHELPETHSRSVTPSTTATTLYNSGSRWSSPAPPHLGGIHSGFSPPGTYPMIPLCILCCSNPNSI